MRGVRPLPQDTQATFLLLSESVGLTCAGEAIPIKAFSAGAAVGPWCVDAVGVQVALVLFSCTLIQVWEGKSTLSNSDTHTHTYTLTSLYTYRTHWSSESCTLISTSYIHQHIPTHLPHPHPTVQPHCHLTFIQTHFNITHTHSTSHKHMPLLPPSLGSFPDIVTEPDSATPAAPLHSAPAL